MLSHCCFDIVSGKRQFTMAAPTTAHRTWRSTHDASARRPHFSFSFLFLLHGIQTLSIDTNLSETINATLSSIQPSIDLKRNNLTLHPGFIRVRTIGKRMGWNSYGNLFLFLCKIHPTVSAILDGGMVSTSGFGRKWKGKEFEFLFAKTYKSLPEWAY
jgi:hypothetical protein